MSILSCEANMEKYLLPEWPMYGCVFFALVYVFAAFANDIPAGKMSRPELEQARKRSKKQAIISAVVGVLSIILPKSSESAGFMDMGTGGMIEYQDQTSVFGLILYLLIPVCIILLIVSLIRIIVFSIEISKAES